MSRWYRAYEGTVSDPKLAEVALIAGCSRSVVIAAWHAFLENAAGLQDGGKIDIGARRLAALLCEPLQMMEAVVAAMQEVGLLSDGSLPAWKDRQYESDNSTERSRRRRETLRNGDATLQQRHATPPETETETESKSSLHSDLEGACAPAPSPEKPKVRKIGTRIPDDWAPSPANVEYAKAKGLPEHRIPTEAERFRNHFRQKSGKDAVKLDWDATWHNWVLRACDFGGFTPKAFNVVRATVWVTNEDPRWLPLADRYRKERGRDPPTRGGNGGQGWDFPADWVSPAGLNSAAA